MNKLYGFEIRFIKFFIQISNLFNRNMLNKFNQIFMNKCQIKKSNHVEYESTIFTSILYNEKNRIKS